MTKQLQREIIKAERAHGWAFKKASDEGRPMSDIGVQRAELAAAGVSTRGLYHPQQWHTYKLEVA